ncbi:hypothetical protein B0J11DRAFT_536538 [Dendryphion nanum]|uniref:Uncharacterized protein n=1 Tax=Dendryphion nanum TaxID=256645 RepID=A0A9P9IFQ9_9PLEO|nr:hypothetical protein B0J11DRAFT_536538 [Dendryphion nanum]
MALTGGSSAAEAVMETASPTSSRGSVVLKQLALMVEVLNSSRDETHHQKGNWIKATFLASAQPHELTRKIISHSQLLEIHEAYALVQCLTERTVPDKFPIVRGPEAKTKTEIGSAQHVTDMNKTGPDTNDGAATDITAQETPDGNIIAGNNIPTAVHSDLPKDTLAAGPRGGLLKRKRLRASASPKKPAGPDARGRRGSGCGGRSALGGQQSGDSVSNESSQANISGSVEREFGDTKNLRIPGAGEGGRRTSLRLASKPRNSFVDIDKGGTSEVLGMSKVLTMVGSRMNSPMSAPAFALPEKRSSDRITRQSSTSIPLDTEQRTTPFKRPSAIENRLDQADAIEVANSGYEAPGSIDIEFFASISTPREVIEVKLPQTMFSGDIELVKRFARWKDVEGDSFGQGLSFEQFIKFMSFANRE